MGVRKDNEPSTGPRSSDRLKRKAQSTAIASSDGSSDSVQITKVRKIGEPLPRNVFSSKGAEEPLSSLPPKNTKSQGKRKATVSATAAAPPTQKRPKRYRDHPPRAVQERLGRAKYQRMYVLSRTGQQDLSETFTMAGSTGNVYTIKISSVPSCNCPDGRKNNTCKHILYIMHKALKAPENLVYQAGLLPEELEEIFAHAPRQDIAKSNRKPLDQDDCPICFCPFDGTDEATWCKAQCGTNIHTTCFRQWKATKGAEKVTCVMCRQPWQDGDAEAVSKVLEEGKGAIGAEGYVNVAGELGMSGRRDYSTYNGWFTGATQYGYGYKRRRY